MNNIREEKYEIKIEDYVLDNVHGYIGLTKVEKEIEALPIFQRLRRIKQLGLADIIFPGAEHTRYIHSLGVMYIIDQMALKLGFNDEERQIARLAGMLHDIGHYPLSHLGESVYKDKFSQSVVQEEDLDNYLKISNNEVKEKIKSMKEDDSLLIKDVLMKEPKSKFHHEFIGTMVIRNSKEIKQIISKNCSFINIDDICDIITGNIKNKKNIVMAQLLHSELDADRLDYLLRDAAYSGASYGKIELGSILKNLTKKMHSGYGVEIVGVTSKGIAAADQFLVNRFFAYSQVIFHKYVAILGQMSKDIMKTLLKYNKFPTGEELKDMIINYEDDKDNKYLKFTDDYFFSQIVKLKEEKNLPNDVLFILDKLTNFRALDLESEPFLYSNSNIDNIRESIEKSKIYSDLLNDIDNCIYVLDEVRITNHVPIDKFTNAYSKYNENFAVTRNEEGKPIAEESLETCLKHRLINGIAIIDNNSDEEPKLIIDSNISIINNLSRYQQISLKQYKLS